jgi:hypothetical protein
MRRFGCGCVLALVAAIALAVGVLFGGIGLLLGALPDDVRSQISQLLIQFNTSNGYYDLKAPAGRAAATLQPIEPGQPPALVPVTLAMVAEVPRSADGLGTTADALAFDGTFEPWTTTCGPVGEPQKPCTTAPVAIVTGFFIGIERDPIGTLLFGVEVPFLSAPRGLVERGGSTTTPAVQSTIVTEPNGTTHVEHALGGVVVWLRPFEGPNPSYEPFTTTVAAGTGGFKFAGITDGESTGTGTKGLIAYLRVGDPVRAHIDLGWSGACSMPGYAEGLQEYANQHYAASAQDACDQYRAILDANLSTARRLVADAGTQVPLTDQIVKQRYTLVPAIIDFLPLAPR